MIPATQQSRMCIFINLVAGAAFATKHYDLGAVIMFAGLAQFQLFLVTKKYEERELELDKEMKLKDTWVKHHQACSELNSKREHALEDRLKAYEDKYGKITG